MRAIRPATLRWVRDALRALVANPAAPAEWVRRAVAAVAEIERATAPSKAIRAHRAVKAPKKAAKREETSAIRQEVFLRAGGQCEEFNQENATRCAVTASDLDHFFGRVRVPQRVSNCWALCREHHREKTRNQPSAAHWLWRFIGHARLHGYSLEVAAAQARLATLESQQRGLAP